MERFLTLAETCELLNVCHEGVLKFVRQAADPLPVSRAGRRWLFDMAEVKVWAKRQGKRHARPAAPASA